METNTYDKTIPLLGDCLGGGDEENGDEIQQELNPGKSKTSLRWIALGITLPVLTAVVLTLLFTVGPLKDDNSDGQKNAGSLTSQGGGAATVPSLTDASPSASPLEDPSPSSSPSEDPSPSSSPLEDPSPYASPSEDPSSNSFYCIQSIYELGSALRQHQRDKTLGTTIATDTNGFPIGNWCVSQVTSFDSLFQGLDGFDEDLGNWDTSSVTYMYDMLADLSSFSGDVSAWDTSSVTSMARMFRLTSNFASDV
jgi:surface protein